MSAPGEGTPGVRTWARLRGRLRGAEEGRCSKCLPSDGARSSRGGDRGADRASQPGEVHRYPCLGRGLGGRPPVARGTTAECPGRPDRRAAAAEGVRAGGGVGWWPGPAWRRSGEVAAAWGGGQGPPGCRAGPRRGQSPLLSDSPARAGAARMVASPRPGGGGRLPGGGGGGGSDRPRARPRASPAPAAGATTWRRRWRAGLRLRGRSGGGSRAGGGTWLRPRVGRAGGRRLGPGHRPGRCGYRAAPARPGPAWPGPAPSASLPPQAGATLATLTPGRGGARTAQAGPGLRPGLAPAALGAASPGRLGPGSSDAPLRPRCGPGRLPEGRVVPSRLWADRTPSASRARKKSSSRRAGRVGPRQHC